MEESMKDAYVLPKGPLPPVVIREPESRKYLPLPEVPGKGKAKVTEEQVAHDLLSLQKHKKTIPADQYIFQRRVSEPTASPFHDESPYEVLGQSDSEEESENIVLGVEKGGQDEGQARPDPDAQAEDQTGSDANPSNDKARVQSTLSPVVHAGSDHEHMDLDVAHVSPQPSTEQLDEGFTATVCPNVQENLKLAIKESVLLEEPASSSGTLSSLQHLSRDFSFADQFFSDKHSGADKNIETEVESMVNVTIQQALSSISLMSSPIIDLTSRAKSPKEHQQLKATTTDTTTTTTTTLPPPQAPQQSTTEAMMLKHIGELEHILADLIHANKTMEERLDKHGTGGIATFMDWFCKRRGIAELKHQDLEGPAYEIVKVFHPDVIHLQYQMEKCHKLLTDSGRRPALSISKMKATYYPDAGLEQMVPDQFWFEEECKYDIAAIQRFYIDRHTSKGDRSTVRTHIRILSVVRIEVFSMYGYDYMKKIVLRRTDLNEHVIAERDFKYLYPSDFEDLNLLNLQGHLNHLPPKDKKILSTAVNQWTRQLVIRQRVEDFQLGIESYQTQVNLTKPQWTTTGFEYKHDYTVIESPRAVIFRDKYGVQMMMRFNEIHKFSDGTLQQIVEALDYRVKEFRINRMNPGLNTRFWTRKDVDWTLDMSLSSAAEGTSDNVIASFGVPLKDFDINK
nr:hypothetical protein [Tanacetum cinerariifolium]